MGLSHAYFIEIKTNTNIMLKINLTDDIFYVGVNDRKTDLFENHMELPNGVSYNSYLIVDEKVALIDPVEVSFMAEFIFKIKIRIFLSIHFFLT